MKDMADSQKPPEWLWKNYISVGNVSMLAAKGGVGKSAFALWLAGEMARQEKNTLYIDFEDTSIHMGERWKNWGYDKYSTNIFIPCTTSDQGTYDASFPDVEEIEAYAKECNASLIIIDSLSSLFSKYDLKDRGGADACLKLYRGIASRRKCGMLILCHVNKDPIDYGNKKDKAFNANSMTGSQALQDMSRSVLGISMDERDENLRRIEHVKWNLVKKQPNILFRITDTGIGEVTYEETSENIAYSMNSLVETHAKIMKRIIEEHPDFVKAQIRKALMEETGCSPANATNAWKKIQEEEL